MFTFRAVARSGNRLGMPPNALLSVNGGPGPG